MKADTRVDPALDYALREADDGYSVFPVRAPIKGICSCKLGKQCLVPGKHPHINQWQDLASSDPDQIQVWKKQFPGCNWGGLTGRRAGRVILEVDHRKGGEQTFAALEAKYGQTPHTRTYRSGAGGPHYVFAWPDSDIHITNATNRIGGQDAPGVDVRGHNGYGVLPGSLHKNGNRYVLVDDAPLADLPPAWIEAVTSKSREAYDQLRDDYNGPPAKFEPIMAGCRFLQHCRDDAATLSENDWFIASRIVPRTGNGIEHFHELSAPYPGYTFEETQEKAEYGFDANSPHTCEKIEELTKGEWCQECPYRGKIKSPIALGVSRGIVPFNLKLVSSNDHDPSDNPGSDGLDDSWSNWKDPELTDTGNADRFIRDHGRDLKHCDPLGGWMIYTGTHYERDELGNTIELAKRTARRILAEASAVPNEEKQKKIVKHAFNSQSARAIREMLWLSRSKVGAKALEFDVDPWLVNASNGVIDLRTGEIREHRREDLQTRSLPTAYNPDAQCPKWIDFLNMVLENDQELIQFIQRAAGYSLTGSTRERVAIILHGGGRNGKSTLLETLRHVYGPYAVETPVETLLVKRGDDNNVLHQIAILRGARLATASEADEGRRIAEATLKRLTGGDRLRGKFLYRDSFEFDPTHTIWLGTNHKPDIRGTDNAIWDRIRLVPFNVRFVLPHEAAANTPPDRIANLKLKDDLFTEAEGILGWTVTGAVAWYRDGLGMAKKVKEATSEYRAEMDTLGEFISERCQVDSKLWTSSNALLKTYIEWSEERKERPLSARALAARLKERGFRPRQATTGNRAKGFEGIGLNTVSTQTTMTDGL